MNDAMREIKKSKGTRASQTLPGTMRTQRSSRMSSRRAGSVPSSASTRAMLCLARAAEDPSIGPEELARHCRTVLERRPQDDAPVRLDQLRAGFDQHRIQLIELAPPLRLRGQDRLKVIGLDAHRARLRSLRSPDGLDRRFVDQLVDLRARIALRLLRQGDQIDGSERLSLEVDREDLGAVFPRERRQFQADVEAPRAQQGRVE